MPELSEFLDGFAIQQQQQQLSNNYRFCRVWGDPDVDDLTSMSALTNREIASNRHTKNVSFF